MNSFNHTGVSHTVFRLLGIPGLEEQHMWMSIPFLISYVITLFGNSLLICIILTKRSLHEPMYLFLCMLAGGDIVLSTCTVPQALAIFWFHAGEISLGRCTTQLFFIHSTFISESGILLVMVFDRCIAICYPVRYTTILTQALIGKIGMTIFIRTYITIIPIIFLLKRLTFCQKYIIPHTFCQHIGLAEYACNDIQVNVWYGFFVLLSTVVLDIVLIFFSYVLILQAVFRIPSQEARHKALNTCSSHVCVIILFYGPGIFTTLTQRFGHHTHCTPYPCTAGQCLHSGSSYSEPHHLWDQDQTNPGSGGSYIIYKTEIMVGLEADFLFLLTVLFSDQVSTSIWQQVRN
ncbi:Olfactory receptor 52B4 [Manis javanica]|nr:Olfactory receptor 52B4 [Manis javanica]